MDLAVVSVTMFVFLHLNADDLSIVNRGSLDMTKLLWYLTCLTSFTRSIMKGVIMHCSEFTVEW